MRKISDLYMFLAFFAWFSCNWGLVCLVAISQPLPIKITDKMTVLDTALSILPRQPDCVKLCQSVLLLGFDHLQAGVDFVVIVISGIDFDPELVAGDIFAITPKSYSVICELSWSDILSKSSMVFFNVWIMDSCLWIANRILLVICLIIGPLR